MKVRIRKSTIADLADIAKVHRESFIAAHKNFISDEHPEVFSEARFKKRWQQRLTKGEELVYVAEINQKIVGLIDFYCRPEKETAEVLYLYIAPDYWRHGVGRRLMQFALKTLHRLKIKKVLIWALKENPKSRAFYESLGAIFEGVEKTVDKSHFKTNQVQYCVFLKNTDKHDSLWLKA